MSRRNQAKFVVALLSTLFALVGQIVVWADPVPPGSVPYALGALLPGEDVGYLAFGTNPLSSTVFDQLTNTLAEEMVRLINLERQKAGLLPVKISDALTNAATEHSIVMRDQGCFGHQCAEEPSSAVRACNAGYGPYGWNACYVGETIAAGFADPASVVAAWLSSSGHRSILMSAKFREIGIGYVDGGIYGTYWTADLGSQPDVLPVFVNPDVSETDNQEITLLLTNETVSGWGGIDYAKEVMISNDPDFSGATWEPYGTNKTSSLPHGNGLNTVYVKYRDSEGYEVVSTVEIVLQQSNAYDLGLSTDSLSFLYQVGVGFRSPAFGQVQVSNIAGGSPMSWSAAGGTWWVGYEPGTGTTPGALFISVEEFETSTLGTSQTTISIRSPEAPESSKEVVVTVRAVDQIYRALLPVVTRAEP